MSKSADNFEFCSYFLDKFSEKSFRYCVVMIALN